MPYLGHFLRNQAPRIVNSIHESCVAAGQIDLAQSLLDCVGAQCALIGADSTRVVQDCAPSFLIFRINSCLYCPLEIFASHSPACC